MSAPSAAQARADEIESEVRREVAPDPGTERRLSDAVGRLVARATDVARAKGLPLRRALVAGSAARGTYLRDRMDVDLFLLFDPNTTRPELERMGLELAREVLGPGETRYAEHPYLRGTFEGFAVDAVPGYAVEDPSRPMSAVDRTPFHQTHLAGRHTPATVEQVRLAKQFLRALGIYGSEARTGGLSGYLVELLILRFGSLRGLLTAARGWRIPVRLESTAGARPTVPDDVALVFDDPVDPGRNVATALTRRNLGLLIVAAGEYLDRPTRAAFELRPPTTLPLDRAKEIVRERGTHVAVLRLARPDVVDDILYPQVRKAERAASEEAERMGFHVVGTAASAGPKQVFVLVEVEHGTLPIVRVQEGPPAGLDRVGSFLGKWTAPDAAVLQGPYVGADGKLAVETRRTERQLERLLTHALDRLPLGRDLKRSASIDAHVVALSEAPEDPALSAALAELFQKGFPWRPARP